MSLNRIEGSSRKMLPALIAKRASVAMNPGDIVIHTSGQVDVAVASSALLLGVCAKQIQSTDSDYASNTAVPVEALSPDAVYLLDIGTGTLAASHIGQYFDLKDKSTLDLTGTTYKQFKVVGVQTAGASGVAYVKVNPAVL